MNSQFLSISIISFLKNLSFQMSRRKCSVIGCDNNKIYNPLKIYHRYPLQIDKAKVWIEWTNPKLLNKLTRPLSLTEYIICEDHFEKTHYQHTNSKRLNRNALPTLKLPFGPPPFSTFVKLFEQHKFSKSSVKILLVYYR